MHTVGTTVPAAELKVGDLAQFRQFGAMEEVLNVLTAEPFDNLVTIRSETIGGEILIHSLYGDDPVRIERQEA